MQEDQNDRQYDSEGGEFEKPKDEFLFYNKASKVEEKKFLAHQRFEEVTAKYWQLLRQDQAQDFSLPYISLDVYTKFMKLVYKVLLPLYRDEEMSSEIAQEWIMDVRGQKGLSFALLNKLLFRIAHEWAVNIDLDEYIDLLTRIYERITIQMESSAQYPYPTYTTIRVEFPLDEAKVVEDGAQGFNGGQGDDWLECRSDESNRSEYDYKYEEDQENMMVKKYKKMKNNFANVGAGNDKGLTIKEPFMCSEVFEASPNLGSVQEVLSDISNVYPFGYYAMQFFDFIKQDVYSCLSQSKENNKAEIARLRREMREQNKEIDLSQYAVDVDTGMWPDDSALKRQDLTGCYVMCSSTVYNNLRRQLKDAQNISVRLIPSFPKPGSRSKSRSQLNQNEPLTEMNKFGYNPALERRLCYKLIQNQTTPEVLEYRNIHYILRDPYLETFYRCDINRIESKHKMSIKESDEVKKDEEFVNVETSYKKVRQIVLGKKFGSIFSDRTQADNKEQKRLKKVVEKEEKRLAGIMKAGNISQKGLSETYDEKSFIKMMKGPFYQLDSREGMKNDDFAICADYDIIEAANTQAMRILVIGKPRAGKSTVARNIAKKLDLIHINVDNWIAAVYEKIKAYEPPDLEEDQVAPQFLTDLELAVTQALAAGSGPTDDNIVEIIRQQINSPIARTKGYILDLPFYPRVNSWTTTIRQQQLLGVTENGASVEFTHVVELLMDDEEIRLRATNMRVDPTDGVVYSRWEREERKKPKPVSEDDDQDQGEEENEVKPFDESTLIQRINDTDDRIKEELNYYNTMERPAMEELLISLFDSQYIKIDSAGLTPDDLLSSVTCRITLDQDLPLRPIAIQIENGGDFKSLLTEGQEEGQVPRKWSLWKLQDPVALAQGKVIQGTPEFAASFHNSVFVFSSEDNMKLFLQEPKKYLTAAPAMPGQFRVLMLGPKGVGKHTQAKKLYYTYGWQIVDFKEIVRAKIEEMSRLEIHIPNNPLPRGRIGMSENELQEVIEGKAIPAWKFIPWIFDFLGQELEKRRPPPPEQRDGEEVNEEEEIQEEDKKAKAEEDKKKEAKKKKEEEEKKKKEEEEIQRRKDDRRRRRQEAIDQGLDLVELGLENEEEEEIDILEDLPIHQLALKIDPQTNQLPFVGGFILIGFPETEEQLTKLKENGIEFDKVIYLQDTNEEEPGVEIKKRMADVELYDYEQENEFAQKILGLVKEQLGDDIVKEISCNGTEEDVLIRIMNEIDPFYLKVDNLDDVRTSADLGDEDKKLPKGDFGDYCPVTYVKDAWLVRGNPEQEVIVNGKTYWLAGEKEAEEFKFNPTKFFTVQKGINKLPLVAPPPKIMILGQKGSGVTKQIELLCDKFKLEEVILKDKLMEKLKEEKDKRKRRRLLDRGFKPPLPPEEEGMEPPPDPEIEDDPEDFDRAAHERDVLKMILDASKGLVIDGTWTDLPEDAVSQSLQDLLFESRRVPEIVVLLRCKEKSTFDRKVDYASIEREFNALMEERALARKARREEDRARKQDELAQDEEKTPEEKEEEMAKWEDDRDVEDEEADENDPDKPKLEEMKEKFEEALKERREKDDQFMEEFGAALKEKNVFVIDDIKTDISAEFVFIKLLDRMKENFANRNDLIEKQQTQILKPEEVAAFEKSYNYKHSRFGINSPLSISNPAKSKKYAVLYRERLFFLSDASQQELFLKEPSKYTSNVKPVPLDILIKPKIFVIGLSKVGKSTLCKTLSEKTGVVHLHMTKLIQEFLNKDCQQCDTLRSILQSQGKQLDDDLQVSLLLKRIQFADCQTNGFVLEDYPKTRSQAILLAKKGLVPTNVFHLVLSLNDTFHRIYARPQEKFGAQFQVYYSRLLYQSQNLPNMLAFYRRYYGNVCEIDLLKSKWYVQDIALKAIQSNLGARQEFARDYYQRETTMPPCKMKSLHMDRCLMKQSLSDFKYYCPVSWRNEKILVHCAENTEDCVLYQNAFYYFKSMKERDMFVSNPDRFLINSNLPKRQDLPMRLQPYKAGEITNYEKALNGHCATTLLDEERVVKGDPMLLINYREGKYAFESEYKLQKFLANPFKYAKAGLPVKMPPPDDKVSLYNLSKMEDSISFMEQALGQIVTRALREVCENRLKYPTISVKETMLKLFALFLKTNNPANTEFMKNKYHQKMKQFIQRCELPEEIFDLAKEKGKDCKETKKFIEKKKLTDGSWLEFKENFYNKLGAEYDQVISIVAQEKVENFINYIR